MKRRNLLTNLLYTLIIISLVCFLAVEFKVLKIFEQDFFHKAGVGISLGIAIISVALVEIIFPIADNKDMLKFKKYKILIIVKSVLFAGAVAVLFLYEPFGIIKNMVVALVAFLVLYFAQFFISLDPRTKDEEVEEESETIEQTTKDDVIEIPDETDGDASTLEIDFGDIEED